MTPYKKNLGEKTETVKQSIICMIQDMNLSPGDKLPTQNELRIKLGVGATTVQRAINALTKSNILEIRPHKGVFIKNQNTDGFVARKIGLVSMWQTFAPFTASLIQCLQLQLHQNACQCKLFVRNYPEKTEKYCISFFDGLKRCIEQKEIQGIITTVSFEEEEWDFFRKHNIPVVSLGTAVYNKGFKVSFADILPASFKLAYNRGFKHPALLHCGFPFIDQVKKSFTSLCDLDPKIYCRFMITEMVLEDKPAEWTDKLKNILQEFSDMPHDIRPDVLIVPDDILTGIAHREILNLRQNGSDWNPYFIFNISRQIPIIPKGTIDGDVFEYDIMQKADATVKLLLDIICGREQKPRNIYVSPKHFRITQGKYYELEN